MTTVQSTRRIISQINTHASVPLTGEQRGQYYYQLISFPTERSDFVLMIRRTRESGNTLWMRLLMQISCVRMRMRMRACERACLRACLGCVLACLYACVLVNAYSIVNIVVLFLRNIKMHPSCIHYRTQCMQYRFHGYSQR